MRSKNLLLFKYGLILLVVYNLLGAFEVFIQFNFRTQASEPGTIAYSDWSSQILIYLITFLGCCGLTLPIIFTYKLVDIINKVLKREHTNAIFYAYSITTAISFFIMLIINYLPLSTSIFFLFFYYLAPMGFVFYFQKRIDEKSLK